MQQRFDLDAERALIGSVLLDERVLDELTVNPDDFFQPAHEQLWKLFTQERRNNKPVNPITISNQLVGDGIGGIKSDYLHQCLGMITSVAAAPHYAEIVKGLASLRRIGDVAGVLTNASETAQWESAEQVLDNARAELDRAASKTGGVRVRTFSDALKSSLDVWTNPRPQGINTGWPELDHTLNGGWKPGQLTVVGARPAVGKSLVAGCAAVAAAEHGVGFFSLEMREEEVVARMAAASQGVMLEHFTTSRLTSEDLQRLEALSEKSSRWPMYIEDNSTMSMSKIRAAVRTWKRQGDLKLVIIDYLQLVEPADRSEARERQVSRIAGDCKALAKDFNIHVLALAQVNRNSASRTDARPVVSDLRESGGIEAFADNIILLHRTSDKESEIEFIVGKNRHGQEANLRMVFRPHFASVNSMAREGQAARFGM